MSILQTTRLNPPETSKSAESTKTEERTPSASLIESHKQSEQTKWNILSLIAFRFAFVYLITYNLEKLLSLAAGYSGKFIPLAPLQKTYHQSWQAVIDWIGHDFFRITRDITDVGVTYVDSTFGWLHILVIACFSTLVTAIWSALDKRQKNHCQLQEWFRINLRICLLVPLIQYGMAKVFKLQFADIGLSTLQTSIGDQTPMELLWNFMGYSPAYNTFCGFAEVIPGMLLAFPQLTLLGALLSAIVFANVLMLNLCYDVHVKLYSLHLLLMSIALIAPDLPRLINILLLNTKAETRRTGSLTKWKYFNLFVTTIPLLLMADTLWHAVSNDTQAVKKLSKKPELYGIWTVSKFDIADTFPSKETWQKMFIESENSMRIQNRTTTSVLYYECSSDRKSLSIGQIKNYGELTKCSFTGQKFVPQWSFKNTLAMRKASTGDCLRLDGQWFGFPVKAEFKRTELKSLPLFKQDFRWITEPEKYMHSGK